MTAVDYLIADVAATGRTFRGRMQFRILTAVVVLLGSYLPLSVILLAQNFDFEALHRGFCWPAHAGCTIPLKNSGFALTAVTLCAACFLITLFVLASVRPKQG
jgi:hypothetical protein